MAGEKSNKCGVGSFSCEECGKVYNRIGNLRRHKKIHTMVRPECDNCGRTFSEGRLRDLHVQRGACTRTYDRYKYSEHTYHLLSRPFKCMECGRNFSKEESLTKHAALHKSSVDAITCEVCGKYFTTRHHLKQHSLTHTMVRDFVCAECGRSYTQKGDLNKHIRSCPNRIDKNKEEKEEDNEEFLPNSFVDGRKKYKIKGADRRYQCKVCGNGFTRSDILIKHYATHTLQKLFECEVCGQKYGRRDVLAMHILKHSNEKKYTCGDCGKCYWNKSLLREHIVASHLPPAYECKVCGKKYKQKSYLKVHLKRHNRVLDYICGECGEEFLTKSCVTVHMNKVHSEKVQ